MLSCPRPSNLVASIMADPVATNKPPIEAKTRKERRKYLKKLKRKQLRKEAAIKYRAEEEARLNDPEEQLRIKLKEQEEAELTERGRREFEERERLWIQAANKRKQEEEEKQKNILEDTDKPKAETAAKLEEDDEWDYVEDGPPEIIWQGNEIIIKKKKVKVAKKSIDNEPENKDVDRPTSNPLPPQPVAFASYNKRLIQDVLDDVGQEVPNFGTEQDKAHCPFHLKTGACRFGTRCNRVHFYPDKSCTLLIKNMYNGPGLAWEQDEGLEHTDEEVERSYEEFYEDVHTEFMKFGELINFKVCRNGSYHLRGNVYVHYKSLESAILAYNTMNGRFFAGKQLTCEFVGVSKWKIAICGEYMKSRLKTCSRGTACNFIHCFRNPGGDYEWADWDNPPPNYWARKMAEFFGHSNQSSCEKNMELESLESRRDSNRKRTSIYSRRHDSRSTTNKEVEDQDKIRDRHSSNKSDRSSRRKETRFADKHDSSDDNCRANRRSYYEDEGMLEEKDREITGKHKISAEKSSSYESHRRHKRSGRRKEDEADDFESHKRDKRSGRRKEDEADDFESHKRYKRSYRKDEISTHKHEKSESKYRSSRHLNGNVRSYQGDGKNESSRHSSEEYHLSKNGNDLHDRYVGKYCSSDIDSDTDYDNMNKSGYNYGKHSSDEGDGCKTARDLQNRRSSIKRSRESCERKHEVSSSSSDESLGRRAQKRSSRRRI